MVPRDALRQAVGTVDWLVVLAPYTQENHHLVSADVIAAMKPGSYLINVARGGLVDDTALAAAVREMRLAGAALDVFEVEPLPGDHPLWTLDNVILTHHTAGYHRGTREDTFAVIEENLCRFLAGDFDTMIKRVAR
jgi:phosphoglycerate dehydrogenase-like enzyme